MSTLEPTIPEDVFERVLQEAIVRPAGRSFRGEPARLAHHDPRPLPVPPDWSGGYTSIFEYQQGAAAMGGGAMM